MAKIRKFFNSLITSRITPDVI